MWRVTRQGAKTGRREVAAGTVRHRDTLVKQPGNPEAERRLRKTRANLLANEPTCHVVIIFIVFINCRNIVSYVPPPTWFYPTGRVFHLLCITNRYVNLITYANTKLKQRNSKRECFFPSIVHSCSQSVSAVQIVSIVIDEWWCYNNQYFFYFIIINEMKVTNNL